MQKDNPPLEVQLLTIGHPSRRRSGDGLIVIPGYWRLFRFKDMHNYANDWHEMTNAVAVNDRAGVDAGWRGLFAFVHLWSGTTQKL